MIWMGVGGPGVWDALGNRFPAHGHQRHNTPPHYDDTGLLLRSEAAIPPKSPNDN